MRLWKGIVRGFRIYCSLLLRTLMSLKSDLRSQVIQLLQVMSEGENIIQCIKEALVMHEEFNPIVLFETLSHSKQRILRGDMVKFLEKHSVQFSNEEVREYSRENHLGKQISFHDFIDSVMPFNADALRVYKESYLEKLAIRHQDAEVELLYRELMDNELKFIRSIDIIKNEVLLSCRSSVWKVNQLIKSDLVGKSKIREGKKFEEKFDDPNNEVSFIDLRRFLELWVPTHEVVLLNLMRRLRTENPLKPINLRLEYGLRNMSRSKSKGRSKERAARSKPKLQGIDYEDFKRQLEQEYEASQNQPSAKKEDKRSKSKPKAKRLQEGRWQREKKNTQGTLIKKLFQTIISKEESLEKQRKKLFQSKDFNMINLFKLIDNNNDGVITEEALGKFHSKYSGGGKLSWGGLVEAFGKESGGMRFHELYQVLQPLSKDLIKSIANKQQDSVPNPFKEKTLDLIVTLFKATLSSIQEINKVRQEINDKGQDSRELFSYLDLNNNNCISSEDIKQLLEEDEFFTDSKDMKLLFKYLDKKVDEKLDYNQFKRFLEG